MHLASLLDVLPEKLVTGQNNHSIREIVYDSRLVKPGDLFVAIRESSGRDGSMFISSAIENGAVAIVHEQALNGNSQLFSSNITDIQVPNANQALSFLADCQYQYPARDLSLIGVTGTNGKTTVTYLIASIIQAYGKHTGVLGTAGCRFDVEPLSGPQNHTTPYPPYLQQYFRTIVDKGGQYAILEISSHALALDRVASLGLEVGVYTNLSRDHLDYHGTFEAYRDAKLRLFQSHLNEEGTAVINIDDVNSAHFIDATRGKVLTYSLTGQADIHLERAIERTVYGADLSIQTPAGLWQGSIPLLGEYNVMNAMAAIGAALAIGIPLEAISNGLCEVKVPGRLEEVDCGQDFRAIVDYAHTPDALQSVLSAVRQWTEGKVIVVFGCGGDRDRGKRSEMGEVTSRLADEFIVTSDNPRTERPDAIIEDIKPGIPPNTSYSVIIDRSEAIGHALGIAEKGDTVVVAGKGHEDYQEIGITKIPFDDREEIRTWLRNRTV